MVVVPFNICSVPLKKLYLAIFGDVRQNVLGQYKKLNNYWRMPVAFPYVFQLLSLKITFKNKNI